MDKQAGSPISGDGADGQPSEPEAPLPDNPSTKESSELPGKIDFKLLNDILDNDDHPKSDKPITETEGYKAWLQLLQLVFKDDKKEITRQALMQADTLKDGLQLLKKQAEAMIHKIKSCSKSGDGSLKNQILDDFDKALQKDRGTRDLKSKIDVGFFEDAKETGLSDLYLQAMAHGVEREIDHQERQQRQKERQERFQKENQQKEEFYQKRRQRMAEMGVGVEDPATSSSSRGVIDPME